MLVVQPALADQHVVPAHGQAGDLAIGAGAADEHADLVAMAVGGSGPYVQARLHAHHVAIEAGPCIALPVDLAALPHQPPPCGAERALAVQQALFALALVEGTQAGQRGLAQQRGHHGVGSGFQTVQRHQAVLVRCGGRCSRTGRRRTGAGQAAPGHRHVRHRWIAGRGHGRRFRRRRRWRGLTGGQVRIDGTFRWRWWCRWNRRRWRHRRCRRWRWNHFAATVRCGGRPDRNCRTQVPVLAGAGADAALEQEILVGAGRDRCEQREGTGRRGGTVQRLHHQDAVDQRGCPAAARVEDADAGAAGGRAAIDHQPVAGGVVRRQHGTQVQPAAIATVVAAHGEHIARRGAGHIDAPGVDHIGQRAAAERTHCMRTAACIDRAGVIHGK
ncbi:hypothetical protein D3C71_1007540 [compost metagenome]